MNKFTLILIFLYFLPQSSFSQYKNIIVEKTHPSIQINQIDFTPKSTLVYMKYTNNGAMWVHINDKTKLVDKKTGTEYKMINSINIPISDEGEPKFHILSGANATHYFCLEFEKLPENIESFDLINDLNNPNAFNCFNVQYDKSIKTDFISIDEYSKKSPVKEFGYKFSNGKISYYYKHKGLAISFELTSDNSYGKYYQAWFNIQNFTGSSILVNPNLIFATFKKEEEIKELEILSHEEYIKKVNRNQNWENFALAFSNGLAASSAGYSRSTTTTAAYGTSNTYGQASGYVGNTYGSFSGRSTSYSTAYGRSTTETYNGAAAYAAQQNANAQTEKFINEQYTIKNKISEGYLKVNSLANQTELTGFVNIKFAKIDNIKISFPLNGETYIFEQKWKK